VRMNKNYTTTRQSPPQLMVDIDSYSKTPYSYMFLDDFCKSFNIEFSRNWQNGEFYSVNPESDPLVELLSYENSVFLERAFDDVLQYCMRALLLWGTAYIEVVLCENEKGKTVGISLLPIRAKRGHTIMRLAVFVGKTYNGQRVKFRIDRKHLIILDLKDVGFRRKHFVRLMKKMNHLDITASDSALMENSNRIKCDFTEHNRMRQYKLLKLNKRTGWFGREYNDPHLTESYLLYRIATFKKIGLIFCNTSFRK